MTIPNNVGRKIISDSIQEWVIGDNGERNRQILHRKLIDGLTFEMIAEEFDLSDRQVKNIVYKWRDKVICACQN